MNSNNNNNNNSGYQLGENNNNSSNHHHHHNPTSQLRENGENEFAFCSFEYQLLNVRQLEGKICSPHFETMPNISWQLGFVLVGDIK